MSRLLVFLAVVITIVGGGHYYLWARLVRDTALPAPYRQIAAVVMVLLAIAMPMALIFQRSARPSTRALFYAGYAWMGLLFLVFVSLVLTDVLRLGLAAVNGMRGIEVDAERRLLIARILGGAATLLGAGAGSVGLVLAWRPVIERVTVPLAKLPAAMSGLRIVQITDVHVGPTIGREHLQKLVDMVNGLRPDLVAITGDLVDGSVARLAEQMEPLREIRAKHGVFFVTGNHEYYSGAAEWVAHLTSLGIRVLRNERVAIDGPNGGFDLAGVDDFRSRGGAEGHGHDLPAALRGRDPSREVVLLAHQPKSVVEASQLGVGLQISGHTHGGQIFPWRFLVLLDQPFVEGLHKLKETWVYVSRGTGFWGPPMRVGSNPEVTEITLVRA